MFWFLTGAIFTSFVIAIILWGKGKGYSMKWYELVLAIVGSILFFFTLENFLGSFEEATPQAAWMFLLVTGLPSIILLAVAWQLVARRNKA